MRLTPWIILSVALAAIAVPAATSSMRTTAPSVYVNVHITLDDGKVIMKPKTGPRGSDARLIVKNVSKKPQLFAFDYADLGNGLHSGFLRVFKPGQKSVLILYLSNRGFMPYWSGRTYARARPTARGKFLVGNQCALCNPD
jgi:hypothetical protein